MFLFRWRKFILARQDETVFFTGLLGDINLCHLHINDTIFYVNVWFVQLVAFIQRTKKATGEALGNTTCHRDGQRKESISDHYQKVLLKGEIRYVPELCPWWHIKNIIVLWGQTQFWCTHSSVSCHNIECIYYKEKTPGTNPPQLHEICLK